MEPGETGTSGSGEPTPDDPVVICVTSPRGGLVLISARSFPTQAVPTRFNILGLQINITARRSTPEEPIVLDFDIHASLVSGGGDVDVFKDGVLIASSCLSAGIASPDPCVASSTTDEDRNLSFVPAPVARGPFARARLAGWRRFIRRRHDGGGLASRRQQESRDTHEPGGANSVEAAHGQSPRPR